ncbi:four helix bundle protein [Candidatus Aminicenantes bacterium AC-708-M15]|nr:four helix bundle protein [SCandidatus Aminicenantes bacterium Aminicenantia_JdfR_composite]MCP2597014.1 four helix bundle protein [Candidatus Aminicenantes bacterium AC-335-G13]MCP2604473.1 four helix bundle protein [Candidatus Aminicenantes bacterium AC-708-M15]MCP2619373.1 four helix bundle protein [Candidatus Aminicenantes bacterium AC-335-K20]
MIKNSKIKAWQKADNLAWEIFNLVRNIIEGENDRELKNQIKECAIRIPVLISSGSRRKDINCLRESLRLIDELEYLIHFSRRLGYLKEEDYKRLVKEIEDTSKLLFGFTKYVEKQMS